MFSKMLTTGGYWYPEGSSVPPVWYIYMFLLHITIAVNTIFIAIGMTYSEQH